MVNYTCNATLEDLRITSEDPIAGELNFHQLGLIIAAACTLVAVLISCYSMWMHALHYTKPYEQRHILRILFMVPIYAIASLLSFAYYWHSIYFDIMSNCYEAFAIASFFALLCHYVAPTLHEQKNYFRNLAPIKDWVWPLSWCCCLGGREKGAFRTPRSGLTWFNIIWSSIYQYCFMRVVMTITAVLTQHWGKYCQSSDNPIFAHIWVLCINSAAVTVAMYGVIQFYYQLRQDLAHHSPFLKVIAIKLVIFLSFWQTSAISVLTGANVLQASAKLAYPDIAVGIPSLLICIEMACFSILHLFAYPFKPYTGQRALQYPSSGDHVHDMSMNELGENRGGPFGIKAFVDAMNPWDLIKAFARGMRWLFVGVKARENDPSYKQHMTDLSLEPRSDTTYKGAAASLPAASLRRSDTEATRRQINMDEAAGLIAHAQSNPAVSPGLQTPLSGTSRAASPGGYVPARLRYDTATGQELGPGRMVHSPDSDESPSTNEIGVASPYFPPQASQHHWSLQGDLSAQRPLTSQAHATHAMLWGPQGSRQQTGLPQQYQEAHMQPQSQRPYPNQF